MSQGNAEFLMIDDQKLVFETALDLAARPSGNNLTDKKQLRILAVRAMARIQSFPDSFTIRSKVKTGGKMRRFEVPQYTQVSNAAAPLLGLALGRAVGELIRRLGDDS